MKTLGLFLMLALAQCAKACLPAIPVWPPGTPVPRVVVEGIVIDEYARDQSAAISDDRVIRVQPKRDVRGHWNTVVDVTMSCGESFPKVGDQALIARLGDAKGEWVLIREWQKDEFFAFLGK